MNISKITRRQWTFSGIGLLLSLLIFCLGIEVGNGQLNVSLWAPHSQNTQLPDQLDYSSVTQLYQQLKSNYNGKLTTQQLLDGLKAGLAESTNDPYTQYFTAAQAKDFTNLINNSISGIGAELSKNSDGDIIVVAPIKDSPAYKSGLKAQDIIAQVDGQSTSGMALDAVVNKIHGPAGTHVVLGVVRDNQALSIIIRRDNIKIPSVTSKTLPDNLGYIQISSFGEDTASSARDTAQQFKQKGIKGLIVDLRGDPGGLLDTAVKISSLWLPADKTIVEEMGTRGSDTLTAIGNPVLEGVPTVVLIDGGSASASEITAGALHDNGAAYIIGTKSYGKGVVQQIVSLSDGGELKVTVSNWYRPNGQSINKTGITPDKVVNLSDADLKAGNDTQLTAAEAYLAGRS